MVVRPNMVCYSAVVLATVLLMLSCASSTPAERLTVHMPEPHDTLVAHVNLCISGAPGKDIYVDEHGVGKSSLCPVANRPLRSRSSKVRATTPSRPRKSGSAAPAMASPPASKPASKTDLAIPASHAGKLVWPASCRHGSPAVHLEVTSGALLETTDSGRLPRHLVSAEFPMLCSCTFVQSCANSTGASY